MGNWKVIVPKYTKNLCTIPSFEDTSTTGWITGGTNTLARSRNQACFGTYSMKITHSNNTLLAGYQITVPSAGDYTVSGWVYVPTGEVFTGLSMQADSFTSATQVIKRQWEQDVYDQWFFVYSVLTIDSGDLTGNMGLVATGPSGSPVVYLDGFQIEAGNKVSTYVDGDQEDCSWNAEPHQSTSERRDKSRAGGEIVDIADTYDLNVTVSQGTGMPQAMVSKLNRALLDGAEYQDTIIPQTTLTLTGLVLGLTLADYHSKKNSIVSAFGPDQYGKLPTLIEYWGNTTRRQLEAYYTSGLEGTKTTGFDEKVAIRMESVKPYWSEPHWQTTDIDVTHDVSLDGFPSAVGLRDNYKAESYLGWDGFLGTQTGATITNLFKVIDFKGDIFVGGDFLNFDGDANADYLAYWDRALGSWEAAGTGPGGVVRGICLTTDSENIIVVGDTFINRFNKSGLVGSVDGGLYSIGWTATSVDDCIYDADGNLWVTGDFLNLAGAANSDYIAYWDGTSWNSAGTGLGGAKGVRLAVDHRNRKVYVVGTFSAAGGVSNTDSIARWDMDTGAWETVGGGVSTGTSIADIFVDDDGKVYVVGDFSAMGGVSCDNIAVFDGVTWQSLGAGLDDVGTAITKWQGKIVVGGDFTNANGIYAYKMAQWNGSTFAPMDLGYASQTIHELKVSSDGELMVAVNSAASYYSDVTEVTVPGNVKTYPIVEMEMVYTSGTDRIIFLGNETIRKYVYPNHVLQPGEKFSINFEPEEREVVSTLYGDFWTLLPASDFGQFLLTPGSNFITLYMLPGNSLNEPDCVLRWKNRYWGID